MTRLACAARLALLLFCTLGIALGQSSTIGTGPVSVPVFSQTASVTVANSSSETTVVGAGVGSITLPANFLIPGRALRIQLYGFHSSVSTPTLSIKIKLAGNTVLATGPIQLLSSSNQPVIIDALLTCRSTGAMGTAIGQGSYVEPGGATISIPNTTTSTIDTTSAMPIDITITWSVQASGNTFTSTNILVESIF